METKVVYELTQIVSSLTAESLLLLGFPAVLSQGAILVDEEMVKNKPGMQWDSLSPKPDIPGYLSLSLFSFKLGKAHLYHHNGRTCHSGF